MSEPKRLSDEAVSALEAMPWFDVSSRDWQAAICHIAALEAELAAATAKADKLVPYTVELEQIRGERDGAREAAEDLRRALETERAARLVAEAKAERLERVCEAAATGALLRRAEEAERARDKWMTRAREADMQGRQDREQLAERFERETAGMRAQMLVTPATPLDVGPTTKGTP